MIRTFALIFVFVLLKFAHLPLNVDKVFALCRNTFLVWIEFATWLGASWLDKNNYEATTSRCDTNHSLKAQYQHYQNDNSQTIA